MYKIIALVRVSSDIQDTASQRDALSKFISGLGFSSEEIMWHEVVASATKAKKDYTDFIDGIKNACLENDIKNICVYHLNRIGRREEYLFGFKRFCVENQVQLYCMEPNFKLLDDDGKVNSTSDIIYNMFISFVQSETKERESKLVRGKVHKHIILNKYGGGRVLYGYSVNETGDLVVNPDESKIVQEIFDMYSTGQYSSSQICRELNLRGITRRGGKWFPASVSKMLKTDAYSGAKLDSGFTYPAIISVQNLNKSREIKRKNMCGDKTKESKLCNLAVKLVKCTECGRKYIALRNHYCCVASHNSAYLNVPKCKAPVVNMKILDSVLWSISKPLYVHYRSAFDVQNNEEIDKEIGTLKQVISGLVMKTAEVRKRKESLEERYYSGKVEMTEQRFLSIMESNGAEIEKIGSEIESAENRIELLEARKKVSTYIDNERFVAGLDLDKNRTECRDIIRSVVESVSVRKDDDGFTFLDIQLSDRRVVKVKYKFKSRIKFDGETVCGWFLSEGEWIDYVFESWNKERTGYDVRTDDRIMEDALLNWRI